MASIGTWSGISIDPALLSNRGYLDPITVNGVVYPRLIAYMVAMTAIGVSATLSVTSGTTQGSNTVPSDYNEYTTVSSGIAVTLPALAIGKTVSIYNRGANALLVFPATGVAIDGGATNASSSVASGAFAKFTGATAARVNRTT